MVESRLAKVEKPRIDFGWTWRKLREMRFTDNDSDEGKVNKYAISPSHSWESIWHEDCSLIIALSYIKDGNILQTMALTADSQTILALLGIGAWHAFTQLTILNQFATATNSGTGEDRKRTNGTNSKCLWDYGCRNTSYIPHFAGKSQCKGHQFACWGGSQHFNQCNCAKTTTLRSFADTELRHRPQLGSSFTLYTLGRLWRLVLLLIIDVLRLGVWYHPSVWYVSWNH